MQKSNDNTEKYQFLMHDVGIIFAVIMAFIAAILLI